LKQTFLNLGAAFVGESMARNRYTMYNKVARTEGYEQIAGIFVETADQERVHARVLFELLQGIKAENSGELKLANAEGRYRRGALREHHNVSRLRRCG
jgi:rubrerythrin